MCNDMLQIQKSVWGPKYKKEVSKFTILYDTLFLINIPRIHV